MKPLRLNGGTAIQSQYDLPDLRGRLSRQEGTVKSIRRLYLGIHASAGRKGYSNNRESILNEMISTLADESTRMGFALACPRRVAPDGILWMADLIRNMLRAIFPEADKLELVDAYKGTEDQGDMLAGLEEVKAKRAKGGLRRAVVVYGFDSDERIRQNKSGSILDAPGVFYLRLPALLSDIKKVFDEAANIQVIENNAIDEKSFSDYAIREISAFKHRCDNLWISMEMNANIAKMDLDNSPETMPSELFEFKTSHIEKLLEEYRKLDPVVKRLGIADADKVTGMMDKVIGVVRQIQDKKTSPPKALNLAFVCVEKGRALSAILEKAKELKYGK